jgi:hypothetical protein
MTTTTMRKKSSYLVKDKEQILAVAAERGNEGKEGRCTGEDVNDRRSFSRRLEFLGRSVCILCQIKK